MDKKKLIQIKLKDSEYEMLKNQAEHLGLNISAYLRYLVRTEQNKKEGGK